MEIIKSIIKVVIGLLALIGFLSLLFNPSLLIWLTFTIMNKFGYFPI